MIVSGRPGFRFSARSLSTSASRLASSLAASEASMNRRQFISASGAASLVAAQGVAPVALHASTPEQPILMKLGDQTAPTNETHLKYLARYSVHNICGYPQIDGDRLRNR
jgi:mannonate dehydratase